MSSNDPVPPENSPPHLNASPVLYLYFRNTESLYQSVERMIESARSEPKLIDLQKPLNEILEQMDHSIAIPRSQLHPDNYKHVTPTAYGELAYISDKLREHSSKISNYLQFMVFSVANVRLEDGCFAKARDWLLKAITRVQELKSEQFAWVLEHDVEGIWNGLLLERSMTDEEEMGAQRVKRAGITVMKHVWVVTQLQVRLGSLLSRPPQVV